ncbi:MAG: twin-arginine translocation signal domain-containing protein [Faecalibacterium sp.]
MSLAFSRRSFLKYSAVAAVAVAGASLFSGCESQGDSYNLLRWCRFHDHSAGHCNHGHL